MSPRSLLTSPLLAGLAATLLLIAPSSVQAEGLFDFLLGGNSGGANSEWGGPRQNAKFDPKYTPGQIIVSFGDRRLYLITHKGEAISYPIAVPRDDSRWQGTTSITSKKVNPPWRPTAEMLRENPKLPTWVPGGHPMNPLGVRAMYLGASNYRIHGTDSPWTIGKAVSQGCIRMTNEDVLDLYPRVPVGTRVTVTWERFSTDGTAVAAKDDTAQSAPSGDTSAEDQHTLIGALLQLTHKNAETADTSEPQTADAGDPDTAALPDDFVELDENGHAIKRVKHASAKVKETARKVEKKPRLETASIPMPVKAPEMAKVSAPEPVKTIKTAKVSEPAKVLETAKAPETAKASAPEPVKATDTAKALEPAKATETAKSSEPEPAKATDTALEPAKATETAKAPEPTKAVDTKPAEAPKTAAADPAALQASTDQAVAAARKAAEAAAKAAVIAREAAEAAKKAAAEARKAASASTDAPEPGKSASAKRAAL